MYSSGEQGHASLPFTQWPWSLAMFSVGWEGSGRMGRAEGWSRKRLSKREGAWRKEPSEVSLKHIWGMRKGDDHLLFSF